MLGQAEYESNLVVLHVFSYELQDLTLPWGHASLIAKIPLAERIKDQFDSARDSQFFENPIEVVPDRMLLNLEPLSDFTVLQAVGDEANHIFLATRQQRHSVGIV